MVELTLEVQTAYPCAGGIGTREEQVADGVHSVLAQKEYILQVGIETLGGEVHLQLAELTIPIQTQRGAVRILRLEVGVQVDERHIAAHSCHVQVFVVGLRRTVTAAVAGAEHQALDGRIAHRSTRVADRLAQHVMFLQARTDQYAPRLVFPLVLRVGTDDMGLLVQIAVVTHHPIVQTVERIFGTHGQVAVHTPAGVRETVLQTRVGG